MTRKKNSDSAIGVIDKATDELDDTFFESNALETDNISNIIKNHGVIGIESALTPTVYDKVESDDSEAKMKIKAAVEYVKENYMKDLNMAVVSNYISMN